MAGVVGLIVLGAEGSFYEKLDTGFGSIAGVLRQISKWHEQLVYLSSVIRNYNTLTASEFNQRYGGEAISRVMESLNEAVAYGQVVYQNLTQEPFSTLIATLFAFLIFYIAGRACRFYRQKGQGSFLVKRERKLGQKIFMV